MNRRNLRYGGWGRWSAAVGVGVVVVSGVGVADAATNYFALGASNAETKTATLSNSNGTPLSLVAKAGTPPLKVNSKTLVGNLNAQFVGGLSASSVQQRVFMTAGTTTITVPPGTSHAYVVMVGGGGAGDPTSGGCGGGQGATVSVFGPVAPGDRLDVVVGGGGVVGGANGTDAGGPTSVGPHGGSGWADAFGGYSGAAGGAGGSNDWGGGGTLPVAEASGGDASCTDLSGGGDPNIAGSGGFGATPSTSAQPGVGGYVLLTFDK